MVSAAAKWQEWASFALGLWLAVSPWVLDHASLVAPTANAAVLGLLLALVSHFEVALEGRGADWINLLAGVWLVAAPFVLDFQGHTVALANSLAVGVMAAALAASALSLDKELGKWWNSHFAGN